MIVLFSNCLKCLECAKEVVVVYCLLLYYDAAIAAADTHDDDATSCWCKDPLWILFLSYFPEVLDIQENNWTWKTCLKLKYLFSVLFVC